MERRDGGRGGSKASTGTGRIKEQGDVHRGGWVGDFNWKGGRFSGNKEWRNGEKEVGDRLYVSRQALEWNRFMELGGGEGELGALQGRERGEEMRIFLSPIVSHLHTCQAKGRDVASYAA